MPAVRISSFPKEIPYILPLLVAVDLRLRSASRWIAGPHAGSQNIRFSFGKPYILRLLVGADPRLRAASRWIAGPHAGGQNDNFSLGYL
jgi:hypothetical protein